MQNKITPAKLQKVLRANKYNIRRTAVKLKVTRQTVYNLMSKYGLRKEN